MPGPVMMKQTPGLAGDPGIAVGHEAGTLLVPRRDVPDPGRRQAAIELDRVHAGDAEHGVDPVRPRASGRGPRRRWPCRFLSGWGADAVAHDPVGDLQRGLAAWRRRARARSPVMSRMRSTEASTAAGLSSIASWWKSITPPALAR